MGKFPEIPLKITEIPVSPRFALMLAFEEPLSEVRYALPIDTFLLVDMSSIHFTLPLTHFCLDSANF